MTIDADGNEYEDNGERAVFYARGVLETVKKLRWIPDVIHCQGWISALAPLYIKKSYNNEPSFCDSKVVFSASSADFKNDLGRHNLECIPFKDAVMEDIEDVCGEKFGYTELAKLAVKFSDGLILEDNGVDPEIIEYAKSLGKPVLEYSEGEAYQKACSEFYSSLMPE
jgi:starch synthase